MPSNPFVKIKHDLKNTNTSYSNIKNSINALVETENNDKKLLHLMQRVAIYTRFTAEQIFDLICILNGKIKNDLNVKNANGLAVAHYIAMNKVFNNPKSLYFICKLSDLGINFSGFEDNTLRSPMACALRKNLFSIAIALITISIRRLTQFSDNNCGVIVSLEANIKLLFDSLDKLDARAEEDYNEMMGLQDQVVTLTSELESRKQEVNFDLSRTDAVIKNLNNSLGLLKKTDENLLKKIKNLQAQIISEQKARINQFMAEREKRKKEIDGLQGDLNISWGRILELEWRLERYQQQQVSQLANFRNTVQAQSEIYDFKLAQLEEKVNTLISTPPSGPLPPHKARRKSRGGGHTPNLFAEQSAKRRKRRNGTGSQSAPQPTPSL